MHSIALAVSVAFAGSAAHAATITVTDGGDAGSSTTCTLRQAIESANADARGSSTCADGSGDDTIEFVGALINSKITLSGSELHVSAPLTITGSGQIIDANHASRVMYIDNTTFAASDVMLAYGTLGGSDGGAGLRAAASTVTLTDARVSQNAAYYGAGISLTPGSHLSLVRTFVDSNTAVKKGGGVYAFGGTTTIVAADSPISDNASGQSGGGVFLQSGSMTLSRSSVFANSAIGASQSGAGIYADACGSVGLVESTVANNLANHQGGGILVSGSCTLTLVNSTVSDNHSTVSGGGGVYVENGVSATLVNSTISGNMAMQAGGVLVYDATLVMRNTIDSDNSVAAQYSDTTDLAEYGASTASAQYSLLGTGLNTGAFNAVGDHNVFSDFPGLGPLEDNGGPTVTRELLFGSPAIDAGSNALAQNAGLPLQFDQRASAFLRRFDARVDIGAFEYQGDRVFAGIFESGP
jgi:predicted outer membrane repeat protein